MIKPISLRNFIFGGVLLTAFALFTLYVKFDLFVQTDFDLLVKIQDQLPQLIYPILSLAIVLGSFIPSTVILVALMRYQNRLQNTVTLFFYGLMHAVEIGGKFFLDHSAPPYRFFKQDSSLNFPLEYSANDSYPSGHTLRAFFLATVVASIVFKKNKSFGMLKVLLALTAFTLATLIALGKVGLGHHWVSDIVGGILLGTGGATLARVKQK